MSSEYRAAGGEVKVLEGGAAAKGEGVGNRFAGEELDECAAEDQVLFDLPIEHPRRVGSPLGDEVLGNQRSASTVAFKASFQRSSRGVPPRSLARTRGATSLARVATDGTSLSARSLCPVRSEEVAESLHPCDGTLRALRHQKGRVDGLDEFGENRGDMAEASTPGRVPHQFQRSRLGRRNAHEPSRALLLDNGGPLHLLAREEQDPDLAAFDGAAVSLHHHLKRLRTLVGGAMEFGRAELGDVVGLAEMLHELRHELFSGEAPEAPVLGR